jgi:hypothetical protein
MLNEKNNALSCLMKQNNKLIIIKGLERCRRYHVSRPKVFLFFLSVMLFYLFVYVIEIVLLKFKILD